MKLLADENVDAPIVNWLKTQGLDLLSIRETYPGISDEEIIVRAAAEDRVILTNDLDFGELVFHRAMSAAGIILVRVHPPLPSTRLAAIQTHWDEIMRHAQGNFLVVTRRRLRLRPLL